MSCLTRENVTVKESKPQQCELDEGRSIMLRPLSAVGFLDMSDEVMEDGEIIGKGLFAVVVVRKCACDEQGKDLFESNDEVEGTLSITEIAKAAEFATDISGLKVDESKKNLTDGDSLPTG